jgi:hypothetical protein
LYRYLIFPKTRWQDESVITVFLSKGRKSAIYEVTNIGPTLDGRNGESDPYFAATLHIRTVLKTIDELLASANQCSDRIEELAGLGSYQIFIAALFLHPLSCQR